MSRKRLPCDEDDISAQSAKRACYTTIAKSSGNISTPEEALKHVHSLFKTEKFRDQVIPIMWKHQLYAIINNRTDIDRKLNTMCRENKIRFFRLGTTLAANEMAICFYSDYVDFLRKNFKNALLGKYLNFLLNFHEIVIVKEDLKTFSQEEIIILVQNGLLATNHREMGSWLLSVPNAGMFIKSFLASRNALFRMFRSTKFNEIQELELRKKSLPKKLNIEMEYMILDVIGSDAVQRLKTPSGSMLRLVV